MGPACDWPSNEERRWRPHLLARHPERVTSADFVYINRIKFVRGDGVRQYASRF